MLHHLIAYDSRFDTWSYDSHECSSVCTCTVFFELITLERLHLSMVTNDHERTMSKKSFFLECLIEIFELSIRITKCETFGTTSG